MSAEYSMQSEEQKKLVDWYISRHDSMKTARGVTENHWQELMKYIVPRKNDINTTRAPGDKRNQNIFDSTAVYANVLLASALHGMLTNPTTRFFELAFGNQELDRDEEIRGWLQDVANIMFVVMNNSNFQTEIHELYIDLGAIGMSCLFVGENDEKYVHFNTRHMKEILVQENNLGMIDTVDRIFKWKPRQIVQEFGEDKVPPFIVEEYKKGSETEYDIIHSVGPPAPFLDPKVDPKSSILPIKSCYILKDKKAIISESGFREFPYAVPRWTKVSGEVYGRGPGHEMLADIKMINSVMETTLKGAQKTIDPPLMVSDDGVIGQVWLTPGSLTIVRPTSEVPIRPLITDARIDFGLQFIDRLKEQIKAGFFVDQLRLAENSRMTQLEVQQRVEESLRLMGPVLGRQHFEFLRPVIERVFGICARRGLFPPAPSRIQGKKFDVKYSSLVARAQRISEGRLLMSAMNSISPILQIHPEAADLIDADESVKYIMDVYGIPSRLVKNQRDVDQTRESRAKAQEAAVKQQQEAHQSQMVGQVGPAVAQLQQAANSSQATAK